VADGTVVPTHRNPASNRRNSQPRGAAIVDLAGLREYSLAQAQISTRQAMAKYLQCSECGKLAFYYDDFVGTEKPFYKRFMRYPEGETKLEPPRCFSCGGVPRMIHENIKEEKAAAAKH
jgi:hypothetical protein